VQFPTKRGREAGERRLVSLARRDQVCLGPRGQAQVDAGGREDRNHVDNSLTIPKSRPLNRGPGPWPTILAALGLQAQVRLSYGFRKPHALHRAVCSKPGDIAGELLTRFDLTEAGARRAGTYSGGMRRRLDIAMSLIGDPAVVFLDEPTTGLDPQARQEVWTTVERLAKGGTTVLLTTQYLEEAERLADRIAILHEGRIIADNTLAGLRALLPPVKKEYVERRPTLEDVFLALVATDTKKEIH